MAMTGVLGTASSLLGNFVLGYGSVVSSGKNRTASDSANFADAASALLVMPTGISVSASDSARFTAAASVSPVSQTLIGWISPEQSTVFRKYGGFYFSPNNLLGVAVYASTVSFDLALSDEYDGADLLVTAFWTSNLSSSWSGTITVQVFDGKWQSSGICWSGVTAFTFPSGAWTLRRTQIILPVSSAPFALVPGKVYTVAFTITPSGSPSGFGSLAVPFLLLEAEVQNK